MSFAFSLYLSRRHLDAMMEALKTSRYLYVWGSGLRGQGWFGGVVLVTKIAGIVVMPGMYIRHGEVDPVEIKNFPPRLKRLLIIYVVMVAVAIIWIAIGVMLLKFK
ncbi:hypothetical protein [Pseudomonas sp. MPC6]|uniref:hypothetical protein n=1 Tax=unclassified Pseudomonas TaxID=196821 RepID=UPI001E63E8E7|nr:hypothetical protein [Pseudomonas sp. MPC6]